MSQNLQDLHAGDQEQASHPVTAGFAGLMSSLISPVTGAPMGTAFQSPYMGLPSWHTVNNTAFSGHGLIALQREASSNDEVRYEPSYGAVDEPACKDMTHASQVSATNGDRIASSPKPFQILATERPQYRPVEYSPTSPASSDAGENARKLQELRARLLAKKSKSSRESSPAPKKKAVLRGNNNTNTISSDAPKMNSVIEEAVANASAMPIRKINDLGHRRGPSSNGINMHLDSLIAEVQNDTQRSDTKLNVIHVAKEEIHETTPTLLVEEPTEQPNGLQPVGESPKDIMMTQPPSDLSDGEIQSDGGQTLSPMKALTSATSAKNRKLSQESEEKSRRESEVEAVYQPPSTAKRDSHEKLRRQSQVEDVYSPLGRQAQSGVKIGLDTSSAARFKPTPGHVLTRSAVEPSSRPWPGTSTRNIKEHDALITSQRHTREPNRNGAVFTLGKRKFEEGPAENEERKRMVDTSAKAAATYKRMLEARARAIKANGNPTIGQGERNDTVADSMHDSPDALHNDGTLMQRMEAVSTTIDPDLMDWLELTEFHDEDFRKGRLLRYRKQKELKKLQAQLEEEEQQELHHRSISRASVVPSERRMAPPDLPSKTTNLAMSVAATFIEEPQTGYVWKQKSSGENGTNEISPLQVRGNGIRESQTFESFKREVSPSYSASYERSDMPFERRISRGDNEAPPYRAHSIYRPRSRSGDRYRRRSNSPSDRRRFSGSATGPICHRCGQAGHYQSSCLETRRDSKEYSRMNRRGSDNRFSVVDGAPGVSSNYRGRNPIRGYVDPRNDYGGGADEDKRP